jgi:hypothetical protein
MLASRKFSSSTLASHLPNLQYATKLLERILQAQNSPDESKDQG